MSGLGLDGIGSTFPQIETMYLDVTDDAVDTTYGINALTGDYNPDIDYTNAKFMAVHILDTDGSQYEGNAKLEITNNTTITVKNATLTGRVIAMIASNTTY